MSEIPYGHANKITPGVDVAPGRGIVISCSNAGWIGLRMADGSVLSWYAVVGSAPVDDLSVKGVDPSPTVTTFTGVVTVVS